MKIFKKLKSYNENEIDGALLGFGSIRARDYDNDKNGHLLLFSMNFNKLRFIKKRFIYI